MRLRRVAASLLFLAASFAHAQALPAADPTPATSEGSPATEPLLEPKGPDLAENLGTAPLPPPPAIEAEQPPLPFKEPAPEKKSFVLFFGGYLRTELATFYPERFFGVRTGGDGDRSRNAYVGRNDGFTMGGARLNVRGTYGDDLYVRIGFDGAVRRFEDANDPVGGLTTRLIDAYARYTVAKSLEIYVGRFKPPFNIEELTPQAEQMFVHRALESRGVLPTEGFAGAAPGFAPGRQVGVMIGGNLFDSPLDYALALTNGSSGDLALNDNDLPAAWGRLSFAFGKDPNASTDEEGPATYGIESGGLIGLSAFYNEATFGLPPNRTRERMLGLEGDVGLRIGLVDFRGQFIAQRTQPVLRVNAEPSWSLGGHAQLGIEIPRTGFMPAYRFALYNPFIQSDGASVPTIADDDMLIHHTVGVSYRARTVPVVSWLEYTRAVEQAGRKLSNDRVEAAIQVIFE